jgi:predicted nucleic-acid-binding Zn-ribbon protein
MNNTLSLLKTYFYINNSLSLISENKYESLIVEYSTILDNTLVAVRNSFFEKDLDKNNLLVINKNNVLTRNEVKDIDSVISLFFDFQNKNQSHLSTKNIIYTKFYASNKVKYDEYHLALDNYNEYIISYNKTKSDLFTTKTIAEN